MKIPKNYFGAVLLTAVVATSSIIYSCTKTPALDDTGVRVTTASGSNQRYTDPGNIANPDNPMDYVGRIHNEGLDYVLDHRADWHCDPNLMEQKGCELSAQFYANSSYGQGPASYPSVLAQISSNVDMYQAIGIDGVIENVGSAGLKEYLNEMVDLIEAYNDSTQIDTLIASIKQIEQDVNASSLSPDDKAMFNGAASIARYSSSYWFGETILPASQWVHCNNNVPIPMGKFNWTKFWTVVAFDVAGFLIGDVPGAVGLSTVGSTI